MRRTPRLFPLQRCNIAAGCPGVPAWDVPVSLFLLLMRASDPVILSAAGAKDLLFELFLDTLSSEPQYRAPEVAMEAAIVFIGLFGILFVIGAALGLVAFTRLSRVDSSDLVRIPELLRRVAELERRLGIGQEAEPVTAEPVPRPVVRAPVPRPSSPVPPRADLETVIAGRWLNRVGLLLVFLAAFYALKWEFDNNVLGPTGRVALWTLIGAGLVAYSQWLAARGDRILAAGRVLLGLVRRVLPPRRAAAPHRPVRDGVLRRVHGPAHHPRAGHGAPVPRAGGVGARERSQLSGRALRAAVARPPLGAHARRGRSRRAAPRRDRGDSATPARAAGGPNAVRGPRAHVRGTRDPDPPRGALGHDRVGGAGRRAGMVRVQSEVVVPARRRARALRHHSVSPARLPAARRRVPLERPLCHIRRGARLCGGGTGTVAPPDGPGYRRGAAGLPSPRRDGQRARRLGPLARGRPVLHDAGARSRGDAERQARPAAHAVAPLDRVLHGAGRDRRAPPGRGAALAGVGPVRHRGRQGVPHRPVVPLRRGSRPVVDRAGDRAARGFAPLPAGARGPRGPVRRAALLLLAAVGATQALPAPWKHWQYSAAITVPPGLSPRLVRVLVPDQVSRRAREDWPDLRVIDDSGREVPFVLHARLGRRSSEDRAARLMDVTYKPGDDTRATLDLGPGARRD